MRLQRYPDGPYKWSFHIWNRHPQWSVTWTHSVTALWFRPGTQQRFARIINWPHSSQREYGFKVGRLQLEWRRQNPMSWSVAAE